MHIGYIVKRYPRYSETFVVNEILAHEANGLPVDIFALMPSCDTHFQDLIASVRGPVRYLRARDSKASVLWNQLHRTGRLFPRLWHELELLDRYTVREVVQALMLAEEVQRRGIIHLHAHFATSATSVARLAARICEVPYSFTAHAKDIYHESVDTIALGQKFSDAAFAVTITDYNLKYLQDTYGKDVSNTFRIYNGLDLNSFKFQTPEVRPPLIVSVGRLVEKKGIGYLIDACRILADQGQEFRCRIIGSGELEQDLQTRVCDLDLKDVVELCGPRPQNEVKQIVQGAAVFAAPCVIGEDGNRDGLPTVMLEAMALGTPCVGTSVAGITEVLHHRKTGLVVAQKDPAALAGAMAELIRQPVLRARLARTARELIESQFDLHSNTAQLRMLIQAHTGVEAPQVVDYAR